MKTKLLLFAALFVIPVSFLKAQKASDSVKLVKTFTELITICKTVDLKDPKVVKYGTFYQAAPYIIYRGKNNRRQWKDFVDYTNEEEKKEVDNICQKINNTVNQDSSYKILQYLTKRESEGMWHVLIVSYMKNGVVKHTAYAFLKVKGEFGLGDID
jgi:hypothetical protein